VLDWSLDTAGRMARGVVLVVAPERVDPIRVDAVLTRGSSHDA
jgi:hypothetical protein